MEITILAFGIAKDIIGGSSICLELPAGADVSALKERLGRQFPEFERLTSLAVAVNAEYASGERILSEQDEVVLIPPVSGG